MSETGPRIGYLCLEAPREGQASYTHVTEIISGLRALGWLVELFTPSFAARWERPPLVVRLLHFLAVQFVLCRSLRELDLIYVRAHPLAWPTAVVARLRGVPVIQEVNGTYEDLYVAHPAASMFRRILDSMQRRQYRSASALITVTERLAAWLMREGQRQPGSVLVIANGANVELFRPGVSSSYSLPQHYVAFVGGLTAWHGVGLMIGALRNDAWPRDLHLVVAGDGPEVADLKRVAAQDSRLHLLGRVPYNEVPGVLCAAAAGLVPISDPAGRSSAAGLSPIKLYEVLACGVPVVATDLPGLAEFLRDNECGVVVPCDDPGALAGAVARLTADCAGAERMGRKGREVVLAQHSWTARARDTAQAITCVLAGNAVTGFEQEVGR